MSNELNRRQFMGNAALGTAAAATTFAAHRAFAAPSDRVIIGVMGLSRGKAVATTFAKLPGVEVRYLCDVDSERTADAVAAISSIGEQKPKATGDFRHILDDPEVNALVCAAPDHWHAPATILACSAGKHVYVEKPCCHNPHEGEIMVEVAARHKRAVQVGTQRRSSANVRAAMELLHGGEIGRVYSARATYTSNRESIGRGRATEVPVHLDYALWQGPAPETPYLDNRIHYNWHWFWHWGSGELGNNGVHTLDLCRWGLGVDFPVRVSSSGGRYAFEDDQETPDTHTVGFEFDDKKMITWQGHSCNIYGEDFVNFYGERGTLTLTSRGNYSLYDGGGKLLRTEEGNLGESEHVEDFLAAIRNDTPSSPHCNVADAYKSTLLCHLGNIAHRTGRALKCDPSNGYVLNDAEAMAYWKREYNPDWETKILGA